MLLETVHEADYGQDGLEVDLGRHLVLHVPQDALVDTVGEAIAGIFTKPLTKATRISTDIQQEVMILTRLNILH